MEAHAAGQAAGPELISAERGPELISAERAARVRREVAVIFAALVAMTLLEVAVSRLSAGRGAVMAALVGLAVAKAGLLGLFFMHLRHETRALRRTVLWPLLGSALYGIGMAVDGVWRMLR